MAIVDALLAKLDTGDGKPLQPSGVWPLAEPHEGEEALDFLVCEHNLKSGRMEPQKLLDTFESEAAEG